jgi:hypothetical protein
MVFPAALCSCGVDDDYSTHESNAILYKAEDIESHPQLGFTPADFAFITLICGGDYPVCSVSDSGDSTPDLTTTFLFRKDSKASGPKSPCSLRVLGLRLTYWIVDVAWRSQQHGLYSSPRDTRY